jgi:gamma-glutamyltranspeptidase/glutathione hydrolase
MTTTLNNWHGSAVVVRGAGFLLNDEMDDFTSKPGSPNLDGLIMGEVNAIAPGKRMLSSMTPTIVLDQSGQPLLVTGASGGPRIISAVFQLISNLLDYDLGVSNSISAPRFHHQHLPDQIDVERGGFDVKTVRTLETMGHTVKLLDFWPDGWIVAATIERRNGRWHGSPDPRLHGAAGGH